MKFYLLNVLFFVGFFSFGQDYKTFLVDGLARKAIIYKPTLNSEKTPVVFVFHGHGGNAKYAANKIVFQDYFKEAVVVFMEGIPGTSGYVVDKEGVLNGWQMFPTENGNRDVRFFDVVLKDLEQKFNVDKTKIYLVGHSNGARFVNVLWKERGDKIAAICSVSAQGGLMIQYAEPISIWMSMGISDPLVSYKNQKLSVPIVGSILKIDEKTAIKTGEITIFKGINHTELVLEERNAGHEFPINSIPKMVEFFKRHSKN